MLNPENKANLVYIAVPSRLIKGPSDVEKQMDEVTKEGKGPLHPFQAFPFTRYEGGPISKARTWEFCLRLVEIAEEFWLFGVSHGSLNEMQHAIKLGKPIKLLLDEFDPNWREYYAEREPKNHILDELLNQSKI
jgi:hypothetical protein